MIKFHSHLQKKVKLKVSSGTIWRSHSIANMADWVKKKLQKLQKQQNLNV